MLPEPSYRYPVSRPPLDPRIGLFLFLIVLGGLIYGGWRLLFSLENPAPNRTAAALPGQALPALAPAPAAAIALTEAQRAALWKQIRAEYRAYAADRAHLLRLVAMTEDSVVRVHRKPPFTFDLNVPPLPPGTTAESARYRETFRSQRADPVIRQSVAQALQRVDGSANRLVLLADAFGKGKVSDAFRLLHKAGRANDAAVREWMRTGTDIAHEQMADSEEHLIQALSAVEELLRTPGL